MKILKYLATVVILTGVAEPSSFTLEVMWRAVPVPQHSGNYKKFNS